MTVITESELMKRALAWVFEARKENPDASLLKWVDEAGVRFNLSPLQGETLLRLLKESEDPATTRNHKR